MCLRLREVFLGSVSGECDKSTEDLTLAMKSLSPWTPGNQGTIRRQKTLSLNVTLQCERQSVWFNSAITYPAQTPDWVHFVCAHVKTNRQGRKGGGGLPALQFSFRTSKPIVPRVFTTSRREWLKQPLIACKHFSSVHTETALLTLKLWWPRAMPNQSRLFIGCC